MYTHFGRPNRVGGYLALSLLALLLLLVARCTLVERPPTVLPSGPTTTAEAKAGGTLQAPLTPDLGGTATATAVGTAVPTPLPHPIACAPPPAGMVAWWPLDETSGSTVHDVMGGHDGSVPTGIGGLPPAPQPLPYGPFSGGMVNGALFFGWFAYVPVPSHPALDPERGNSRSTRGSSTPARGLPPDRSSHRSSRGAPAPGLDGASRSLIRTPWPSS